MEYGKNILSEIIFNKRDQKDYTNNLTDLLDKNKEEMFNDNQTENIIPLTIDDLIGNSCFIEDLLDRDFNEINVFLDEINEDKKKYVDSGLFAKKYKKYIPFFEFDKLTDLINDQYNEWILNPDGFKLLNKTILLILKKYYENIYNLFRLSQRKGVVKIMRIIALPVSVKKLKEQFKSGLGIHWTAKTKHDKNFLENLKSTAMIPRKGVYLLVHGFVDMENINWSQTICNNMVYPEEFEVTVYKGSAINITDMFLQTTNEIDYEDSDYLKSLMGLFDGENLHTIFGYEMFKNEKKLKMKKIKVNFKKPMHLIS